MTSKLEKNMAPTYNHLTMLKTIHDKLKEVSDRDDMVK